MATSFDCKYIETSVGINHNVDELLVGILTQIIYRNNLPASKLYGPGSTNNRYVYNAALELNAVAFMIRKAAVSGINPY